MKTAAISGAVIAALAVGALATPSSAQPYRAPYNNDCSRSDGTAGTVIGGIAGALLGSNLAAHHGGRAGGAAIGGVAGALIGNSIARGSSCETQSYNSGYRTPTYGYSTPAYAYAQPAYGYETRYSYNRARYEREHYRDYDRDRGHDRDDWHSNFR